MSSDQKKPVAPGEPVAMAAIFALYAVILTAGIAAAIVVGLAHN